MATPYIFNMEKTINGTFCVAFFDKLCLTNIHALPRLSKITAFVTLKNLDSFDSSRILAASFLLRAISGQKPYVVRFGLFQTFKERDFDAVVQLKLVGKPMYSFWGFLVCTVVPALTEEEVFLEFSKEKTTSVVVLFTISDLSFMRFIEMHSAFFRWHDILNIRVELQVLSVKEATLFFKFLKF